MNDEEPKAAGKKSGLADSERVRAERQAAALRENLRKRNAQRRGRRSEKSDSKPLGNDK